MKIQGLKNLNITLLFSSPLNHLLVEQANVIKLFTTGDEKKDSFSFVEAPSLKLAIFPNQKKDIVFENSRIILSDKSGDDIDKTTLITDFRKVLDGGFVDQNKIIAYGFNYEFLVENDNNVGLVSEKIMNIPDIAIKNTGINITFEKAGLTHALAMVPTGQETVFLAQYNAHFNSAVIPSNDVLLTQLKEQISEFERIIENL